MGGDDGNRNKDNAWPLPNRPYQEKEDVKFWTSFLFGLIGDTATTFAEEAWKRCNCRMREEYEQEMERVERIERMQSVFNRERNKDNKSYESWRQNDYDYGAYHHHFQRDDWYWKADTSYRDQRTNFRPPPRDGESFSLSHHYSVLGLDSSRKTPYTEAEIKTAVRSKAKEFHPDQNQDNKGGFT